MKVKLLRKKNLHPKTYQVGEIAEIPDNIARRWVNACIAQYVDDINDKSIKLHDKVSIVILVKDALKYIKRCIKSINKYTNNFELIIVDNGSNVRTKKWLKNLDWLDFTLIENKENKGVSYGWNQGIKVAKYDYICFINSDCLVSPGWLGKLMKGFKYRGDVGIVGPTSCRTGVTQSVETTRSKQHIENQGEINKLATDLREGYIITPVIGFCFIVKKSVFNKIGVFDWKRWGLANYEDVDFVWRAGKVGFKSVWCKASYVHHFGNKTTKELGLDLRKILITSRRIFNERIKNSDFYIGNDVKVGTVRKFKKSKSISSDNKIIATVNIGNYDSLIDKHFKNSSWDFFIFTDNKIYSQLWKPIYIKPQFDNPRLESRIYKWLIHRYFPNAEYSLYIDGNILIKTDIDILIEKYLKETNIAMRKHPGRDCLYQEAEVCSQYKLDYLPVIEAQINRYREEGYPENNGLHEGGIILRRHTDAIKKFNETVWKEIKNGSHRDQLSIEYVAWKLDIKIGDLPSRRDKLDIQYFNTLPHKNKKRSYP